MGDIRKRVCATSPNCPLCPWIPHACAYTGFMINETQSNNPYIATLVEMGYDEADCQAVAHAGVPATYPRQIHGRIFETKAEYDEALADFLNGN